MSDRDHEPREGLTSGDWARYAGLLGLATLVLLVIVGQVDGGVPVLIAVYLLLACAALIAVQVRRRRS